VILSADQVTTDEHEANSRSLLQDLRAAHERIHEKNQRDGRQERRVKRDGFADAEQYFAQRDKANNGDFLLSQEAEEISAVSGNAD